MIVTERPPTSVSSIPRSGTQVKVVPSTMVARKTPFYTELYQGAYTLLVKIPNYPETVEVPFIVEKEDQPEFNFNLDFADWTLFFPTSTEMQRSR